MGFYIWAKAIHIIAVVFWMAALLYLPRLYVYHSASIPGGELEAKMVEAERRLVKIIMTPAMLVALIMGCVLIGYNLSGGLPLWLALKLVLVFGVLGYHGIMSADHKKFARGERPRSEKTYRILNEIPALITVAVVILAVVKPFT